jgi:DNA-binding NarL/FixJ family response regulator
MARTKILIVADDSVVVEGVKSALKGYSEYEIIGQAPDGLQAIEMAKSLSPDVIIMDISMPNLNGMETTIQIRQFDPGVRIISFTVYANKEYLASLIRVGISAYVLKHDPMEDLILALMAVKEGGTYFSRTVPAALMGHIKVLETNGKSKDSFEKLSHREREVFCFLADGKTVKEIAAQLGISPKTVESHKYNIMEKLQAPTLAGLTKIAIKRNLIQM